MTYQKGLVFKVLSSDQLVRLQEQYDVTVALPHIGSAMHDTRHAMALMANRNLLLALSGKLPLAVFFGQKV